MVRHAATAASAVQSQPGTLLGHTFRLFWPVAAEVTRFDHPKLCRQHIWSPVGEDPPANMMALPWATFQTLRSSLSLAPHRMTAYRMHALALCAAASLPFPDPQNPAPQALVQAGPVVPPLWTQQVSGLMSPLPPIGALSAAGEAGSGLGSTASWRIWNRGVQPGSSQAADVPVVVMVAGQGLRCCSHARVCMPEHTGSGFKSAWMPVSLLPDGDWGHRLARPSQQVLPPMHDHAPGCIMP